MTLLYNIAMLAVDVAVVRRVRRHAGLLVWCIAMACAGAMAAGLAGVLGGCFEDHFGFFRLLAYGVFLHGTALLAATAVLWRRTRPALAGVAAVGVAALLLIAADAFLIEPHWLEVSHWRIASPKIHRPLRIVVVADLQGKNMGPYERAVLRQALEEKPDVILLAGDYLQVPKDQRKNFGRELHDYLGEIHFAAPRGVFAVKGNVDPHDWQEIFAGLGITTVATKESFDLGELHLTCLGLRESYNWNLKVANSQPDMFHLVLGHIPNFARGQIEADLLVAGHTHGGQVRLPWIGPMITHAQVPHTWAAGLTDLPSGGQLLVSRGIGMERGYAPPMRFLCRPELVVIDLVPPEEKAEGETADEHR